MISRLFRIAAAAMVLSFSYNGLAIADPPPDPRCPIPTPGGNAVPSCPTGQFASHAKACPKEGTHYGCTTAAVTPVAEIQCDGVGGTIWCEAWPQGYYNEYQYSWEISSGYPPPVELSKDSPVSTTNCVGNQFVTVTVAARGSNLSSNATVRVNCSAQ